MKKIHSWLTIVLLGLLVVIAAQAQEEEEEEAVELVFTAEARERAGIVTASVKTRMMAPEIEAPGEVMLNAYETTQIAPRISAQLVARHARMGDAVDAGTPLVTLSSVDMADAMGNLLVSGREWRRVEGLGRDVVSEARYVEAEVAHQQAIATLLAYGMPQVELRRLLDSGDVSQATGEYTLFAPHDGVVVRDPFIVGEVVEAGRLLMELSNFSTLWVEGRVAPELAAAIGLGDSVRISADDDHWFTGEVVQRYQALDESTRTLGVRIEVANDGSLSPGQFVNIAVQADQGQPVLAVPREAVVLILSAPMVFKLEGDEFEPQPVETGLTTEGWTAITAGLEEGDEIAVAGVFELKSLLLKSQIGDAD